MSKQTLPPFQVGQIVYLIPVGERRVIPAQITEEILRRTIAGTETVWMIQLAGSSKGVPLDPNAAEYFTSVDDLRRVLVERTTQQVNSMIDKTIALAVETFTGPVKADDSSSSQEESSEVMATITLPDGTKARVRT